MTVRIGSTVRAVPLEPPTSLNFVAIGIPSPSGSKNAFRNPRTGRIVVVDAGGRKTKTWRKVVATAATVAMDGRPFLAPPLRLVIEFRMPRPKNHFRANGDLRPDAPFVPIVRPDVTKLLRSTEDSMTGIVWKDDAEIAEQTVCRVYSHDESTGARISVFTLEFKVDGKKQTQAEWKEGSQGLEDIAAYDSAAASLDRKARSPVRSRNNVRTRRTR